MFQLQVCAVVEVKICIKKEIPESEPNAKNLTLFQKNKNKKNIVSLAKIKIHQHDRKEEERDFLCYNMLEKQHTNCI